MACSVFYLVQFACSQVHVRLRKEQASSAIEMCRLFSQGIVQFEERNVFLPNSLV